MVSSAKDESKVAVMRPWAKSPLKRPHESCTCTVASAGRSACNDSRYEVSADSSIRYLAERTRTGLSPALNKRNGIRNLKVSSFFRLTYARNNPILLDE
jgi:hypothetical protein